MTVRKRFLFLLAITFLHASPTLAAGLGGGTTPLVGFLEIFFADWAIIAVILALAGFIWAVIQIGVGRGPGAFGDAIRWLVVVIILGTGVVALLGFAGITAATV